MRVTFYNVIQSNHYTENLTTLGMKQKSPQVLYDLLTGYGLKPMACPRDLQTMALGPNPMCFCKLRFIRTQPHPTSSSVPGLGAMAGLGSCRKDNVAYKP